MKTKIKQIICALLHFGVHKYNPVTKRYGNKVLNEQNQVLFVCERCGKTKWMWEL